LHAAKNAIEAARHGATIQRLMQERDAELKPKLPATMD
jgi:hypothetical protein